MVQLSQKKKFLLVLILSSMIGFRGTKTRKDAPASLIIGGKMKIRPVISVLVAAVVLGAGATFPAVASDSSAPAEKAPPTAQSKGIFVLGSPSESTSAGAEFYAIPEEDRGSLFVMPDVAEDLGLPQGRVPSSDVSRVTEELAALEQKSASQDSTAKNGGFTTMNVNTGSFTYGPGFAWLGPYQRPTAVWGGGTHKYYYWSVDPVLPSSACLQGQGYYTGYNGGSFGLWSAWYGLGCGKSGGFNVPWDNVTAYPKVLSRSQAGYYGGGTFS